MGKKVEAIPAEPGSEISPGGFRDFQGECTPRTGAGGAGEYVDEEEASGVFKLPLRYSAFNHLSNTN